MLVFIDASALKAYYDTTDEFHSKATAFMSRVSKRELPVTGFLTTDYVLDEAITLTRVASSHEKAVELAEAAFSSKFTRITYTDEESFMEAFEFFRRHADKEWSFTDCVSFTTMKKTNTAQAFTFDSHFRQAGFESFP